MRKRLLIFSALACATLLAASISAESKTYQGKECNRDYKRLCGNTPIGRCDLATMMDDLSPRCRAFVEKNK